LHANVSDGWKWLLDLIKSYSVSGVYQLFRVADEPPDRGAIDDIWLRQVPLIIHSFCFSIFLLFQTYPSLIANFLKSKGMRYTRQYKWDKFSKIKWDISYMANT